MKIFAISDLHLSFSVDKPMDIFGEVWVDHFNEITANWNAVVSDDDVVLLCGDLTWAMRIEEAEEDFKRIDALNGTKIIIRGNHDYWWSTYTKVKSALPKTILAIQNNAIKIGNNIFCGTRGWTVPENFALQSQEDKKIFEREILRLEMSLNEAEKLKEEGDRLFVMMHYPPYNSKMDTSPFTNLILKYNADAVIFGHIHGKQPYSRIITKKDGIPYYLTSCDIVKNNLVLIA